MRSAVEHFRVLCTLGLPRHVAYIEVCEALKWVVAADWVRSGIVDESTNYLASHAENPAFYSEGLATWIDFNGEENTPMFLFADAVKRRACGVFVDRQHEYAQTACHAASERHCDAWWLLDAIVDLGGGEIGCFNLLRSRLRKPFDRENDRQLRQMLPWVAHALRPHTIEDDPQPADDPALSTAARIKGSAVLDLHGGLKYETSGFKQLCINLEGQHHAQLIRSGAGRTTRLPRQVRAVLAQLRSRDPERKPPHAVAKTMFGPISIDASLMAPAERTAEALEASANGAALVTLTLHQHPVVTAWNRLRACDASPTQTAVGIRLAKGLSKRAIAAELNVKPSSVEDAAMKLYDRLDVHNAAELGARLWSGGSSHA